MVNSSRASQATLFPNGIAIAIDQVVQNFGPSDTMVNYVPYYVQQNANGSWGQPVTLPGGYTIKDPLLQTVPQEACPTGSTKPETFWSGRQSRR